MRIVHPMKPSRLAAVTASLISLVSAAPAHAQARNGGYEDSPARPTLGVQVSDSPGTGVRVGSVAPGSPADEIGIRPGDFILSVEDGAIETPDDLVERIRDAEPGQRIELQVWRNGNEMTLTPVLATAAETSETRRRAWLGIILEDDSEDGVRISRVLPRSPAAEVNLRRGDVLLRFNGEPIESSEALVDRIEGAEPGEEISLRVRRQDQERTVELTLGSTDDAPTLFGRPISPLPFRFGDRDVFPPDRELMESFEFDPESLGENWDGPVRDQLESMRRSLEEVRRELNLLRRGDGQDERGLRGRGERRERRDRRGDDFEPGTDRSPESEREEDRQNRRQRSNDGERPAEEEAPTIEL